MMIKKLQIVLLIFAVFFSFITPASFRPAFADDAEELRRQIEERNKNIAELQREIQLYKQEVDKTSAKARTLQSTIQTLQLTGKKLDADIRLTENRIQAADLNIERLNGEITTKEQRINLLRQSTAENIRLINEEDQFSFIETFLSTKSLAAGFDTLARRFGLIRTIRDRVDELNNVKRDLLANVHENEETKNELRTFEDELKDKQTVVNVNKNEQNKLLSQTKQQESAYQALIREKEAKRAAFEKELFEYESKLKYTLDPSSIPKAGSSPFAWPVDDVYITQNFGRTSASGRLYTSGTHNGLDMKALLGTPIKAMGNGMVVGTGDTDLACAGASWGKWVLIKYNNGLAAVFAHLSVIKVSEGQSVTTGQVVAYSGNTGYSTGPHLHISVYPADAVKVQDRPSLSCGGKVYRMPIAPVDAYLDPMLYLPK
jgi:murein DD-endopeptidase MepM/ murein hydrolase activator NlpD